MTTVATREGDHIDAAESRELRAKRTAFVFISHDSRDSEIADAFSNLLIDASGGMLRSFQSSDKRGTSGIEFGAEWYTAIMTQLGEATDVVALLTPRSVNRPWILYEAGVAKGKLGTTVLGIALGVPLETVSAGPFGQFQNCNGDVPSLTKLLMQLLRRNPDASPREEAIRMLVGKYTERVESILRNDSEYQHKPAIHDEQNVAKLFEETRALIRDLTERIDERIRKMSGSDLSAQASTFEDVKAAIQNQIDQFDKRVGTNFINIVSSQDIIHQEIKNMVRDLLERVEQLVPKTTSQEISFEASRFEQLKTIIQNQVEQFDERMTAIYECILENQEVHREERDLSSEAMLALVQLAQHIRDLVTLMRTEQQTIRQWANDEATNLAQFKKLLEYLVRDRELKAAPNVI